MNPTEKDKVITETVTIKKDECISNSSQGSLLNESVPCSTAASELRNVEERRNADPDDEENDSSEEEDESIGIPEVDLSQAHVDDNLVYQKRAKLLFFGNNKWESRGVGLLKILSNKTTFKLRLVLWREDNGTVACNHNISTIERLVPHPSSSKAIIWSAIDFSDGTEHHAVFAAQFQTAKDCERFKQIFEAALEPQALRESQKSMQKLNLEG